MWGDAAGGGSAGGCGSAANLGAFGAAGALLTNAAGTRSLRAFAESWVGRGGLPDKGIWSKPMRR